VLEHSTLNIQTLYLKTEITLELGTVNNIPDLIWLEETAFYSFSLEIKAIRILCFLSEEQPQIRCSHEKQELIGNGSAIPWCIFLVFRNWGEGEILCDSFNDGALFCSLMHPRGKRLVETRDSYYKHSSPNLLHKH